MAKKIKAVEIRVDTDRLQDEITIDDFIAMQEGDLRAIRDTLGMFVVNGSGYLPTDEGIKVVGKLTINQLMAANQDFLNAAEMAVVPKEPKVD